MCVVCFASKTSRREKFNQHFSKKRRDGSIFKRDEPSRTDLAAEEMVGQIWGPKRPSTTSSELPAAEDRLNQRWRIRYHGLCYRARPHSLILSIRRFSLVPRGNKMPCYRIGYQRASVRKRGLDGFGKLSLFVRGSAVGLPCGE